MRESKLKALIIPNVLANLENAVYLSVISDFEKNPLYILTRSEEICDVGAKVSYYNEKPLLNSIFFDDDCLASSRALYI